MAQKGRGFCVSSLKVGANHAEMQCYYAAWRDFSDFIDRAFCYVY